MSDSAADDLALLDAWGAGDREAGSRLFNRHFATLYGFFRNKIEDGAEDLAQQTFLAMVEQRESFRRDSSFRTYLFGTARNVLRYELRKRKRLQVDPDFDSQSIFDLAPQPSKLIGEQEDRRLLLEALRRIPLDYQIAIELYHFEGLTAAEVGGVVGLDEGAVRARLRRAIDSLRKLAAELSTSPAQLETTLAGLSGWARDLRAWLERGQ